MKTSFIEYTVPFNNVELMVHLDKNDKIIRVYTYRKDIEGLVFCYVDNKGEEREKSFNCFLSKKINVKNLLFIDLNKKFIDLFRAEIMEVIDDERESQNDEN